MFAVYNIKCNSKSWGSASENHIEYILKYSDTKDTTMLNKILVKNLFASQYERYWKTKMMTESKMLTYSKFKTNFYLEQYLNTQNEIHHKTMTRFRISAHTWAIERGRYTTPPTPTANQICINCSNQAFEDEFHFMMECNQILRNMIHSSIECP